MPSIPKTALIGKVGECRRCSNTRLICAAAIVLVCTLWGGEHFHNPLIIDLQQVVGILGSA